MEASEQPFMEASQQPFMEASQQPYTEQAAMPRVQATPQQLGASQILSITLPPAAPQPPPAEPSQPGTSDVATDVQAAAPAQQPMPAAAPGSAAESVAVSGHTTLDGQAEGVVHVVVSEGAAPGQQIIFRTPDGHSGFAVAPQQLDPGSTISVRYSAPRGPQQTAPLLPAVALNMEDQDAEAARKFWVVYATGWVCCCVQPLFGLLIWTAITAFYYCTPPHMRAQRPRQRNPAFAAAVTSCSVCACAVVLGLVTVAVLVVCGEDLKHCEPAGHPHTAVAPLGGPVNLTLPIAV